MQPIYKAFLVAAMTLQSASAAEIAQHVDESGMADQVSLAMQSRYQHTLVPAPVVALQVHASPRPKKVLSDFARFSAEGAAVRFLYSVVADRRTFISYSRSQRGRPAELRVAVAISL